MAIISKKSKYHEVISKNDGSTFKETAIAIATKYPELLIDACKLGIKQKRPVDGVTHIATCVSSWVSQGRFKGIEVDDSDFPNKIKVVR